MELLNSSWVCLHWAQMEGMVCASATEATTKIRWTIANTIDGHRRGGVLTVRLNSRGGRGFVKRTALRGSSSGRDMGRRLGEVAGGTVRSGQLAERSPHVSFVVLNGARTLGSEGANFAKCGHLAVLGQDMVVRSNMEKVQWQCTGEAGQHGE